MKKIAYALLAVSLGGCANVKAVQAPTEAVSGLQGTPLTVVTHAKPSFVAMTPGKGALGMIGAFAAIGDGNKMVETYQLPDPALGVAAKMKPVLMDKFSFSGSKAVADEQEKITSDSALATAADKNGVVLDVVTIGWGFSYFPLSWSHYNINMNATARLIDARSGKVIAQSSCAPPKEQQKNEPAADSDKAPTYDEMTADNGALIKSTLAANEDACAVAMLKNMFGGW